MHKFTQLLVASVIVGGVVVGLDGSRLPGSVRPSLAMGADIVGTMPPEAIGFTGTLSGEVVNRGGKGWFVIKVVKVIRLARNNRTALNIKALTSAWKDKYVTITGKNMPPVAVGDAVTVVVVQVEVHIQSSRVTKLDEARPGEPAQTEPSLATPRAQAFRGRPDL